MKTTTSVKVDDVVMFEGAEYRVTGICGGRCSHRPHSDGQFLALKATNPRSPVAWNHVPDREVHVVKRRMQKEEFLETQCCSVSTSIESIIHDLDGHKIIECPICFAAWEVFNDISYLFEEISPAELSRLRRLVKLDD